MSEIDKDSDEFKQAVAEAIDEATGGLKAKNTELLAKLKKAQAGQQIDPADLAAVEAERDEWKGKAQAAERAAKKALADAEAATKKAADIDSAYNTTLRDAALSDALAKANVTDPVLQKAARALLGSGLQVVDVDGKRTVKAGEVDLDKHITEWASSDEGKRFVTAPDTSGGGSQGGRGKSDSASDITSDDPQKRVAAIQARLDKNPEYQR